MAASFNATDLPIHWLGETPDLPSLGGKARGLVRLAAADLPVPPGFVLDAAALPPDAPSDGAPDVPPHLPEAAATALVAAYRELGRRLGEAEPLVAVRSSALAEDLAEASFAGQYATVLGVRGERDLLEAAVACWASLWSERVRAYRAATEARLGRPLPAPGMALLVQRLVEADVAGIADTADVVGGKDTVVVRAAWGLGRSVVDGTVDADEWRLGRAPIVPLELRVGDKRSRSGLGLDPRPTEVPEDLRRRPCLTADQAIEVGRLALQAEAAIGCHADVEWAVADGRIWLLQARPLAGATAPEAEKVAESRDAPAAPAAIGPSPAFHFAWPDAAASALHWQGKPDDARIFEALAPFELDVRRLNTRSEARMQWLSGAKEIRRVLEANGYLFYAMEAVADEPERAIRAEVYLRPIRALHARGETLFGSVVLPEVEAESRRLAAVAPDSLSPEDLAAHFEECLRWYDRAWTFHCMMDPWEDPSPVARCANLYRQITGDENRWAVYGPFGHVPQKENEAIDGLIELARLVKESPALRCHFWSRRDEEVLADLDSVTDGPAFRERLAAFLEVYGLECGASQGVMRGQVMPGWREEPSLVVAIVRRYLARDLDALAETRRQAAEKWRAEVEALRTKVAEAGATDEQRDEFDRLFDATTRQITSIVDHNFYIDSPMNALLHRALLACGRRLAVASAIEEPADVWYLRAEQVGAAVRSLGDATCPDWRAAIAAAKQLHTWQRSLTPPEYLGAPAPLTSPSDQKRGEEEVPPNLLVRGRGASPGVATGRVRLIDGKTIVPDVEPGDVFVAVDCGVLWASVLPVVAAVVLDGSFPGEHPMRVCTEFGVPGIVQAKNATAVLRDGQLVTVDGGKGWVLAAV